MKRSYHILPGPDRISPAAFARLLDKTKSSEPQSIIIEAGLVGPSKEPVRLLPAPAGAIDAPSLLVLLDSLERQEGAAGGAEEWLGRAREILAVTPRPGPRVPSVVKVVDGIRDRFAFHSTRSPLVVVFSSIQALDPFSFLIIRRILESLDGMRMCFLFHAALPAGPTRGGLTFDELFRHLHDLMELCVKVRMWNRAAIVLKELRRHLGRVSSPLLKGFVLFRAGMLEARQGRTAGAIRNYRSSLKFIEKAGDRETLVRVLNNLGNVHLGEGHPAKAGLLFARALALGEELQSDYLLAVTYGNYAIVALRENRPADAVTNLRKSLVFTARSGYYQNAQFTYGYLGDAYRMMKEDRRAGECYRKARRICEIQDNPVDAAHAEMRLARFEFERGRAESSKKHLETAERTFRLIRNPLGLFHTHEIRAEMAAAAGNTREARREFREAARHAATLPDRQTKERLAALGLVLKRSGKGTGR